MKKYDIVLVNLKPTRGAEKQGIRPCVVLQNNIANQSRLQTVTIAPITSQIRGVPSMLSVVASKKCGLKIDSCIDFSQMRTLDRGEFQKQSVSSSLDITRTLGKRLHTFSIFLMSILSCKNFAVGGF